MAFQDELKNLMGYPYVCGVLFVLMVLEFLTREILYCIILCIAFAIMVHLSYVQYKKLKELNIIRWKA